MTPFRFTHMSDLHLTNPLNVHWTKLLNKRLIGYLFWRYRRQFKYCPELLATVAHHAKQDGEHLVLTGDLTQIGLSEECHHVTSWLADLGAVEDISVIPGNHDAYVRSGWPTNLDLWRPWMQSDANDRSVDNLFPFVRRRGLVAFIGLSSAAPTAPFFASGRVDAGQLMRLEQILADNRDFFRVVLIHHSPASEAVSWRRGLDNHKAVRKVLSDGGVELVLHGHDHWPQWYQLTTASGLIPVIGTPAASAVGLSRNGELSLARAGYYAYEVSRSKKGWQLNVTAYRLDLSGEAIESIGDRCYELASASLASR